MALSWDDLAGGALGRQFPETVAGDRSDVAGRLARIGPIQAQTARSPFLGLAARFPGTTREEVTAAYESGSVVRGSTIRGTVHTATPEQYAALGAATRVGQRTLWQRLLKLERASLDDLWAATEDFAADWRSTDDLQDHLHRWLVEHEGHDRVTSTMAGRYLTFGHGGLVRRPVNGDWAGQGAPVYRTLPPVVAARLVDAVALHLRAHGPASRHDVAWWSGLGLRVVDELLADLP
ncbi:MAG TPA: crosslink repair DNA glycosylase YcaQ family protein, partial [Nocardioides sp.]